MHTSPPGPSSRQTGVVMLAVGVLIAGAVVAWFAWNRSAVNPPEPQAIAYKPRLRFFTGGFYDAMLLVGPRKDPTDIRSITTISSAANSSANRAPCIFGPSRKSQSCTSRTSVRCWPQEAQPEPRTAC